MDHRLLKARCVLVGVTPRANNVPNVWDQRTERPGLEWMGARVAAESAFERRDVLAVRGCDREKRTGAGNLKKVCYECSTPRLSVIGSLRNSPVQSRSGQPDRLIIAT
jgi:hypothetical protein